MTDTTADAWVFPWDDARKRPRDHGFAMPFVGPDNVAKIFSVHVSIVEPGYRPHEPHTHDDEEAIYLLEGKLEVTIDDQVSVIEPDTVAFLPPGSLHGLRNCGDVNARYVVVRSR